ncbi:MAG: hypothetical protein M1838_005510 [Thelocarpon superellum]|nr:MAG: hypothetical protein M1838_005510 [Thelocarpon superellum]
MSEALPVQELTCSRPALQSRKLELLDHQDVAVYSVDYATWGGSKPDITLCLESGPQPGEVVGVAKFGGAFSSTIRFNLGNVDRRGQVRDGFTLERGSNWSFAYNWTTMSNGQGRALTWKKTSQRYRQIDPSVEARKGNLKLVDTATDEMLAVILAKGWGKNFKFLFYRPLPPDQRHLILLTGLVLLEKQSRDDNHNNAHTG